MKITDRRTRSADELLSSAFVPPHHEPTPVILAGATEAAVVRPGDTLVITFDDPLLPDRQRNLIRHLSQSMPNVQVLVLDGAKCTVVRGEDVRTTEVDRSDRKGD